MAGGYLLRHIQFGLVQIDRHGGGIMEEINAIGKYVDGDCIAVDGVDRIKFGPVMVPLNALLAWDGLEAEMRKCPQIELEVTHTFSGGVYIREMQIPKGIFIIGKRHRHETCNILLKGTLSVYLGDGKPVAKIAGPLIMTSEAMTRKVAYCHEDTVFLNIHPTNETDIAKLEKQFVIDEDEYLIMKGDPSCLMGL